MAKISARGATEVARIKFERPGARADTPEPGVLVLRSDRKVLYKLTGWGGYTVMGTVKAEAPQTAETLAKIVVRRGWKVV